MPAVKNKLNNRIELNLGSGKSVNLLAEGTNADQRKPIKVISEDLMKKKPVKSDKK